MIIPSRSSRRVLSFTISPLPIPLSLSRVYTLVSPFSLPQRRAPVRLRNNLGKIDDCSIVRLFCNLFLLYCVLLVCYALLSLVYLEKNRSYLVVRVPLFPSPILTRFSFSLLLPSTSFSVRPRALFFTSSLSSFLPSFLPLPFFLFTGGCLTGVR